MNPVLVPANLFTSPQDMVVILVIALVVFGPKRLPEIGKQVGTMLREFNKMRGDFQRALNLEEYSRFDRYDNTPAYHTPPYGATYPAVEPSTVTVDVHDVTGDAVAASSAALLPGAAETTAYHDDPAAPAVAAESPVRPYGATPPPGPPAGRVKPITEPIAASRGESESGAVLEQTS